jgi:hypothetical protein
VSRYESTYGGYGYGRSRMLEPTSSHQANGNGRSRNGVTVAPVANDPLTALRARG